jgi:peptide deformylase
MQVVIAPDQRLRVKTKPVKKVTPHLLKTIKDMVKLTKTFVDPEGVGLAATQIGEDEQYFVVKRKDGSFQAVFNPKILSYSKKTKIYFEGCLSIPKYYGQTERHLAIRVSYLDENGQEVKTRLTGIQAWFFQHEFDHLQGKLFMDQVVERKARLFKVVGRDRAGAEIFEEVAI